MGAEDFKDFEKRVRAERSVRKQRDAAEKRIPGERLRREIREAFARDDARQLREDRQADAEADPRDTTDPERGQ